MPSNSFTDGLEQRPVSSGWAEHAFRALILLVLALLATSTQSAFSAVDKIQRVEQISLQIAADNRRWQRNGNEAVIEDIEALAKERRTILESLIRTRPGEAVRLALPDRLRAALPPHVQAELERLQTLEGELTVLVHDNPEGSTLEYRLGVTGANLQLHFSGQAPKLQSGQQVKVNGLRLGHDLAVIGEIEESVLALDGSNDLVNGPTTLANTTGAQRVAVILVNFQDKPGDQPFSRQQAHDLVFGSVDSFYRENSSQRTWLEGDVYGWLTMPGNQPAEPNECAAFNLSAVAEQTALSQGVPLSEYNRHIYVFPATPCYAAGTGTVGGWPSKSWINGGYFDLQTTAHELGHNLGLHHSGALECGDASEVGNCTISTYGDRVDVMGNAEAGHFNAYKKERLGWLKEDSGEVVQATAGNYALNPIELGHEVGSQALKVLSHHDSSTGKSTWYYLEYRQAIGADAFLAEGYYATDDSVTNGVMVRQVTTPSEELPVSSLLLDMTPAGDPYFDWINFTLQPGQAYTDPVSGTTLSTLSVDSAGALVSIDSGGVASCVRGRPGLRMLTAQTKWAAPGEIASYQLEVLNQDSEICGNSDFTISAVLPAGWSASFYPAGLQLAPGAAGLVDVDIQSSDQAMASYFDIDLSAVNEQTSQGATVTATYVVEDRPTANLAPVAADDSVSTEQNTSVDIAALGNDYDPEGVALTVSSYSSAQRGTVDLLGNGQFRYTPRKKFKGTDSFSYTVTDGELLATASVQITVGAASGEDDGTGGNGKGGGKKR